MFKIAGFYIKKEWCCKDELNSLVDKLVSVADGLDDGQSAFVRVPLEFQLIGNALSFDDNGMYLKLKIGKEENLWLVSQFME